MCERGRVKLLWRHDLRRSTSRLLRWIIRWRNGRVPLGGFGLFLGVFPPLADHASGCADKLRSRPSSAGLYLFGGLCASLSGSLPFIAFLVFGVVLPLPDILLLPRQFVR